MLARHGEPEFSSEERNLARGMARVLALTVRLLRVVDAERGLRALSDRQRAENERLLESLEERQRLLERLSKIQRSIVSRRDLQEVLDAIVDRRRGPARRRDRRPAAARPGGSGAAA